ncbi:tubby-related protein 3 [Trichonephila inaurata madagascariensis]|uniref:Tubby-related protein 3 n=1 Tax=Trichonephila inaurata madagascariensis TaxID=2747483 RepID=A0A8X6YZ45_9ARAC|nr:tubby-related protein 3 [Trichonephila inaurata madagascariensis]
MSTELTFLRVHCIVSVVTQVGLQKRQLVEQKQKQKRQKVPGMVHASDSRPQTTRGWRGKEEAKPLMTGYSVHRNNQGVALCKY